MSLDAYAISIVVFVGAFVLFAFLLGYRLGGVYSGRILLHITPCEHDQAADELTRLGQEMGGYQPNRGFE